MAARVVERNGRNLVIGNAQLSVRRNDVHMIGLQQRRRGHLLHSERAVRGNDLGEFAVAVRVKMDDDDERGAYASGMASNRACSAFMPPAEARRHARRGCRVVLAH